MERLRSQCAQVMRRSRPASVAWAGFCGSSSCDRRPSRSGAGCCSRWTFRDHAGHRITVDLRDQPACFVVVHGGADTERGDQDTVERVLPVRGQQGRQRALACTARQDRQAVVVVPTTASSAARLRGRLPAVGAGPDRTPTAETSGPARRAALTSSSEASAVLVRALPLRRLTERAPTPLGRRLATPRSRGR